MQWKDWAMQKSPFRWQSAGGGIIAILSIFGSNVQDLFCILQKQLFPDGTGIEKGADSTTGNYAEG